MMIKKQKYKNVKDQIIRRSNHQTTITAENQGMRTAENKKLED